MADTARIILIDDHPFILDALKLAIEIAWPGAQVECTNSLQAAYVVMEQGWSPTLAMLDLGLPGYAELDALHAFRQRAPKVPVVVFSGLESREQTLAAIDNGAMGFIPKRLGRSEVLSAIQTVMRGELFLPRMLFHSGAESPAAEEAGSAAADIAQASASNAAAMHARLAGLTVRQREIMYLMLQGLSNKVIAERIGVIEGTVKNHISNVFEAMGVSSRVQAVLAASAAGLRMPLHD